MPDRAREFLRQLQLDALHDLDARRALGKLDPAALAALRATQAPAATEALDAHLDEALEREGAA